MDARAGRRSNNNRDTSPERMKLYVQPKMKPFRKVQVLYYLCRNGQLEHPHFVEVTHLANQQLRLKDVIDRLTVLRGKNLPSLFSWSCKRSYKNGYVWNDLTEHDIIYPAEGAEYVLKGSELIEGCAERLEQLQVASKQQNNPELIYQPKRRLLIEHRNREAEHAYNMRGGEDEEEEVDEDEEEEDEEAEEKRSNINATSSKNSSYSRCSRGVSTEEGDLKAHTINPTEISLDDASPPSTSSTLSEKTPANNNISQRFEDGDPTVMTTRGSALLQFIACASSVAMKERNCFSIKSTSLLSSTNARKSSSSSLHRGVLCKAAVNKLSDEDEINYMSENPRFGNPQSQEKEYFSGSIVESMTEERTEPTLKKSSSYNEERSMKSRLGEIAVVEKVEEVKKNSSSSMKGKCLPRKKLQGKNK